MSNLVTNICRPLRIRPTPKCVLMALADRAGDDGVAWPSLAWLCEWTCFSRRAVMNALDELEDFGLVRISKIVGKNSRCEIVLQKVADDAANPGTTCTGTRAGGAPVSGEENGSDPGTTCTSAADAPVQEVHPHPGTTCTGTRAGGAPGGAGGAPDTSITSIKTSNKTRERRASAPTVDELPGVSAELMADYAAVRKAKKAGPFTATALAGLQREAARAGLTLAEAITECCEAGWQGFKAEWYFRRRGIQPPASAGAVRERGVVL